MPASDQVLVDRVGDVATLTLNRPARRNALSDDLLASLVEHLLQLEASGEVKCVVVAGDDRWFCAGADLRDVAGRDPAEVFLGPRAGLWRSVRAIRVPLVAAVSGHCLGGGCELALSCDVIVASPSARFGQPETGLGLIPGGGASQLLGRLVGPAVATDMILTGRVLDAQEALAAGLVTRLSAPGRWLADAREVATTIAGRPRVATLLAKQAIRASAEMPLGAGIAYERLAYHVALGTEDARDRIGAFLEKRQAATSHE